MVRRRDDHFGKGLTVSRGPEIGDRLPDHPAAPSVSPDKSHGPVIDIDDPRLAQKVMIPTADNVRQCCSSFSGNYLDQRITGRDVDLPARCHAGIVADRGCTRRSEEHTSELQSLMRNTYAVFCLTKKKAHTYYIR